MKNIILCLIFGVCAVFSAMQTVCTVIPLFCIGWFISFLTFSLLCVAFAEFAAEQGRGE